MQSSRVDYIRDKSQIVETCECIKPVICNLCFWQGITINPVKDVVPECARCSTDYVNFVSELINVKSDTITIYFRAKCTTSCLWWDWFHAKRRNMGYKIKYVNK